MLGSPRAVFFASAVAVSLASPAVFAQSDADKATARQLAQDGQEALDKKDYATALQRFSRADALFHAPTLVLGIARAEAGQHHFVAAQEAYNRIAREGLPPNAPPVFKKAIEDAKRELPTIEGRISWVTILVAGPSAPSVKLDGAPFPAAAIGVKRAVDPGDHTISASGDGFETKDSAFTATEGGSESVSLTLTPSKTASGAPAVVTPPKNGDVATPPPEPAKSSGGSPRKALGFVGLGLGVAGIGLGAVTGILAMGKHSTLGTECPNGCPPDAQSDLSSYHTLGTLSTVGFIVGGVGAAAGVLLLVTAPKDQAGPAKTSHASVTPFVGPGSFGAVGTF